MSDNKIKNEVTETLETVVEEVEVRSNELVDYIKNLIEQGNVRRLVIRDKHGKKIQELPLTASVVGGGAMAIFAPFLAFVAVGAAIATKVKLEVVRDVPYDDSGL